ncbi:MAG: RluA family pseudouridine synthase [Defluviitaleaceae bacterium]|nr:RluA family pseudouridine synthase [Defluviitaleaceae bacterium]
METRLVVAEAYCGLRADVFLSESIDSLTRSAAVRVLSEGQAIREGLALRKNDRLKAGDIIVCNIPPAVDYEVAAEEIPLDIVYEDGDIAVVNKPRGLVVHPAAGHYTGTLVNGLLFHLGPSLSGIGGVLRPGIVHRLDKDTSGLIVIAKNDMAHHALSAQLAAREMGRTYHALCIGRVKQDSMRIDVPIGRHHNDRKKMAAITARQGGKSREAATNVTVLERMPRFTLVEARLETGRTHQIRVHLSHIGYPVLGDPLYGPKKQPFHTVGQVLHAKGLRLCHPSTGEVMEFDASLPGYFAEAVSKARVVK